VHERQRDEREIAGRRALVAALEAHHPFDAAEAEASARIRAFVGDHPDCFRRELEIGHITGSAWVLDRERRRVLLTHHGKLGLWLQLGGHADGDPDPAAVALREAREESGLDDVRLISRTVFDVDVHRIPARPGEPEHDHYDVRYACEADAAAPLLVSAESKALRWIELERVGELSADASVLRMARKSLAALRS
jgi:8-oxo-dGTP pyrophosphatase MutT (NUDIX family)